MEPIHEASYKGGLGAQYIAYVWHLRLGTYVSTPTAKLSCHNNLVKMMFATHTSFLKDGTKFLRSCHPPSFIPVLLRNKCHYLAPTHCIEMSEIEAAVYLIKIGAFPENREWDLTASTTERPTTEDDFGLLVWKSSRSLIHSTNSFTKCSLSTPISGAPGFSRRPTPLPILVLSFLPQKVTVD